MEPRHQCHPQPPRLLKVGPSQRPGALEHWGPRPSSQPRPDEARPCHYKLPTLQRTRDNGQLTPLEASHHVHTLTPPCLWCRRADVTTDTHSKGTRLVCVQHKLHPAIVAPSPGCPTNPIGLWVPKSSGGADRTSQRGLILQGEMVRQVKTTHAQGRTQPDTRQPRALRAQAQHPAPSR